jgi:hypothetical protein
MTFYNNARVFLACLGVDITGYPDYTGIAMKTVGHRRERPVAFSASAQLLKAGARFNEEFQKLPFGRFTAMPKGIRRFHSHADANRYDEECLALHMAQLTKRSE